MHSAHARFMPEQYTVEYNYGNIGNTITITTKATGTNRNKAADCFR